MDEIDRNILKELKKNGRMSISEISKKVYLSVPAVAERIRKMEQGEIIEKYTIKINQKKIGYNLLAFVLINIDVTENIENFKLKIIQESCVLECYHIAGPNDYLLKVLVRDTEELENFLSNILKKINGVVTSNTIISLSTLKEEINL
ncbi:Lrp/AsnC family transcriptional regulator [Fusobacterium sp.]|uniref:Lrp/AsnC family transcriptional regulator n=1 Tax=Fusobacterium sp. TaxID=68766 RepID=UPI00290064CB|nr:Lrp/AsnC family transcriptional regulator [Fusobacterium sp.]MDU1912555.1 Lrp/AsnC family transcriptional regulator [Fusobacterium sp.]